MLCSAPCLSKSEEWSAAAPLIPGSPPFHVHYSLRLLVADAPHCARAPTQHAWTWSKNKGHAAACRLEWPALCNSIRRSGKHAHIHARAHICRGQPAANKQAASCCHSLCASASGHCGQQLPCTPWVCTSLHAPCCCCCRCCCRRRPSQLCLLQHSAAMLPAICLPSHFRRPACPSAATCPWCAPAPVRTARGPSSHAAPTGRVWGSRQTSWPRWRSWACRAPHTSRWAAPLTGTQRLTHPWRLTHPCTSHTLTPHTPSASHTSG